MEEENRFSASVVCRRTTAESLKPFVAQLSNFKKLKKRSTPSTNASSLNASHVNSGSHSKASGLSAGAERFTLHGNRHKIHPSYHTVLLSPVTAGTRQELKFSSAAPQKASAEGNGSTRGDRYGIATESFLEETNFLNSHRHPGQQDA